MSSDNIYDTIKNAVWSEINGKLHTTIPAIVTSYDATGPKVEAKPVIKKLFKDGESLSYQPIVEVPVMFPRTNKFRMTFPLEKGDGVLLIFTESALGAWLNSGNELEPNTPSKYSITDAVAIPGLYPFVYDSKSVVIKGSKISNKNNLEIAFGDTKIESDGTQVRINTDGLTVD